MASAGTLLIVGGLWLRDEIREILAEPAVTQRLQGHASRRLQDGA
jgi:hypothetical protein